MVKRELSKLTGKHYSIILKYSLISILIFFNQITEKSFFLQTKKQLSTIYILASVLHSCTDVLN